MASGGWCPMSKSFLVTGAAGFIGAALVKELLSNGEKVIGIDNLNSYYDPLLKEARLQEINNLKYSKSWEFYKLDIEDQKSIFSLFEKERPDIVVNLAAQAGVRYSIENPGAYIQTNLSGFGNILEACKKYKIEHLVYASSSSVYGGNQNLPFSEKQPVNHPISIYAATKKANELMAHVYSHLYGIPATGLRFFTVYGPWGRPDMAPMIFAKAILNKQPINIFNRGKMKRDFTYIDDIVEGLKRCCYKPATPNENFDRYLPDPSSSYAPHRIFNIGNSRPTNLMYFIEILEKSLGVNAIKNFKPIQPGDVEATAAETIALESWVGFSAKKNIEEGVPIFADWFKSFYKYDAFD